MKFNKGPDKYGKLIKTLQILSFVVMLAMVILCAIFLKVNNISLQNVDTLAKHLVGGTFTIASIIVIITVIKSFTLIFPPAVLFALSGIVFDNMVTAVLVNAIATACSLFLPYFLGKFMGMELINSLKVRFKVLKKLDDFADENSFWLVFIFKAGGIMSSDLSSLIFGAMNIPFGKYFISSNIGMLFLNILWTLVGIKGDLSNPLSLLYVLPPLFLAVCGTFLLSAIQKKKNAAKNI